MHAPKVAGPGNSTPVRRVGSLRRTMTLDSIWPDGPDTASQVAGRSRDLVTATDGFDRVVREDLLRATVGPDRSLLSVESDPIRTGLSALIGQRAGARLRTAVASVVPLELREGTPLYLLLDDLAGASLVASFAHSQWPDLPSAWRPPTDRRPRRPNVEGICVGFKPGSPNLESDGTPRHAFQHQVVRQIGRPDDGRGWHALFEPGAAPSHRRARRIDVSRSNNLVLVETFFQDSVTRPDGHRLAIHEYEVYAQVDASSMEIIEIWAVPRVLPFAECSAAISNLEELVGTPVGLLRETVLDRFKGVRGCTHLNDVLRSLADVPALVTSVDHFA